MEIQSNLLEKVLPLVAEKLNIMKWRYEISSLSEDIVNYLGILVPVALIDESSNIKTHLMIKSDSSILIPEIEPISEGAYIREVFFYTTLVPLFKENNIISEDYFPSCYYADSSKGNRVLALQNMAVEGFKRYDKGIFLDKEHLTLSLEAVAKFHSLSFVMKEKNIEPQDEQIMKPFLLVNEPQYAYSLQKCFAKYGVALFRGTQHEDFFKNFYSEMTNLTRFMDDSVINAHTLVYGHCDLWKENFLYKYSDNHPVRVCLLDYQMCHFVSPARDVLFLIMNSTESATRRVHYQALLSTYYKALERSLLAHGIDPANVYSETDFHDDIELVFPLCFSVTLFSFVLWLGMENLLSIADITGTVDVEKQKDKIEVFHKIIGDLISDFKCFGTVSM